MGIRNYLIEGVSGTGKTSVAAELQQRGYHAINGDVELAYRGDPETGAPLQRSPDEGEVDPAFAHGHHLWHVDRVEAVIADHSRPISFFCGGSRNFQRFIHLFDGIFVLEIDRDTLQRRLASRPEDEFGARPAERALILRLHATKEDTPADGVTIIDATMPLGAVVDDILAGCGERG